jgi:hypothetical protein
MAGRARTKALIEELEKRCREDASEDTPMSSLDYACEWISSGQTLKALAKDLTDTLHDEVTYGRLMAVLRVQHGEQVVEASLDLARTRASHCLAEESLELVDAYADTTLDVNRAQSRAKSRQWLAQAWNSAKYGQQKGVSVNVTVGSLHLDALRAVPARVATIVTGTPEQPLLPPIITDEK